MQWRWNKGSETFSGPQAPSLCSPKPAPGRPSPRHKTSRSLFHSGSRSSVWCGRPWTSFGSPVDQTKNVFQIKFPFSFYISLSLAETWAQWKDNYQSRPKQIHTFVNMLLLQLQQFSPNITELVKFSKNLLPVTFKWFFIFFLWQGNNKGPGMWSLHWSHSSIKLASTFTETVCCFSKEMKKSCLPTAHPFLSLFFKHVIWCRHQKDKRECTIQAKHPHGSSATI